MWVGLDTHKAKIAVAVAEPGRSGEMRFQGEITNQPDAVRRLIERLGEKHGKLSICYEAGPCGYGLQRQITALGRDCTVVAPYAGSGTAGKPVNTNRRDAVHAGRLHRAGELTAIWIPDPTHEAMRDLIRARTAAMETVPGTPAAPWLPVAPWPGVHGSQDPRSRLHAIGSLRDRIVDVGNDGPSTPALAGRAQLRTPRPADRAAGADRRHR